MSYLIYNSFLLALYPLYILLGLLSETGKTFRRLRKESRERIKTFDASSGALWLHASSVGEFDQALAILRAVKKDDPLRRVILSYFSNSAARTEHPEADFVFALPMDFPFAWSWWLDRLQPEAFVTMTWDVFPNLLRTLQRRKIPSYLACGALASDSRRLRSPYRNLLRPIYSLFTGIGVVDEIQKGHFSLLTDFPERVRITGDSRYDTILYKTENAKLDPQDEQKIKGFKKRIWILGSTYKACDAEILPGLRDLLEKYPEWMVLSFPHHTSEERLTELEEVCKKYGLESLRWSKLPEPIRTGASTGKKTTAKSDKAPPRFLIVDRMGILALAYQYGEFAYVGGGFHHRIHNTGEPAALGLPVLTGPAIDTSPVALLLEKNGVLFRFPEGNEIIKKASDLMSRKKPKGLPEPEAARIIQNETGSAELFVASFLR